MSDATKAAVEAALAADFADEMDGAVMTGYVCQMQGQSLDEGAQNRTLMYRIALKDQPMPVTLGLSEYSAVQVRAWATRAKESFD